LICKKCGTQLEEDALFCGNCGSKVEPDSAKATVEDSSYEFVYPEIPLPSKNTTVVKQRNLLLPIVIAIAVIALIGVSILVFCLVNKSDVSVETNDEQEIEMSTNINEETDEEKDKRKEDLIDISTIDSIIESDVDSAEISVCVIDIKNDVTYSTENSTEKMSASALINIPILYATSKGIEANDISFDTPITFQYKYSGRGTINKEQDGEYFALSELLQQMLNYSDNNATNSLIDYYGNDVINSICAENSYDSVDIQKYLGEVSDYKDNYISAVDVAHMLYDLYESSDDGINKNYLLSNFQIYDDSKFTGIGESLPKNNLIFLNHNAVTSSIYNEVAIVNAGDSEYIITVLCNGGKMETSKNTTSRISNYVYNALNQ